MMNNWITGGMFRLNLFPTGDVRVHSQVGSEDSKTVSFSQLTRFRIREMIYEQLIPSTLSDLVGGPVANSVINLSRADELLSIKRAGAPNPQADSTLKPAGSIPGQEQSQDSTDSAKLDSRVPQIQLTRSVRDGGGGNGGDDDDDYDMEDSKPADPQQQQQQQQQQDSSESGPRMLPENPENPETAGGDVADPSKTNELPEANECLENELDLLQDWVPIDDMYYTLEYDHEALVNDERIQERLRREESEALRAEQSPDGITKQKDEDVHASVKYLFEAINKVVAPAKLVEIKQLLADARPSRSKWASEDRVGQEELYEHLERVLNDLKNMTEHSACFLQKVSKREAPNYFEIIKNPMDLGTMTKKLKALQYLSKKEFADDLYLIWSNCMTFNTQPDSIYRKHAAAMKRRTTELLRKVPDITVQVRAPEVEESESDDDNTEGRGVKGSRKASGSKATSKSRSSKKKRKNHPPQKSVSVSETPAPSVKNEDEEPATTGPVQESDQGTEPPKEADVGGSSDIASAKPDNDIEKESDASVPTEPVPGETAGDAPQQAQPEQDAEAQEEIVDDGSLQLQRFRERTMESRVKALKLRAEHLALPFPERPLLRRTPEAMELYALRFRRYLGRNNIRRIMRIDGSTFCGQDGVAVDAPGGASSEIAIDAEKPNPFELMKESFFPEYDSICEILPQRAIQYVFTSKKADGLKISDEELFELSYESDIQPFLPSLSEYRQSKFDTQNKLCRQVIDNIGDLKHIKSVHEKIKIGIREDTSGAAVPGPAPGETRLELFQPSWKEHELPAFVLNKRSSDALLKQMIGRILLHAGFDAASAVALALITDVVSHYLSNITKTLHLYLERQSGRMELDEILMHTLVQNGIPSANTLDTYIKNDVKRYGFKLSELRKRLDLEYRELSMYQTDQAVADEDVIIEESSEQLISGSLFEEMGVDLLNLKDVGVDALSVPVELWNRKAEKPIKRKLRKFFAAQAQESEENLSSRLVPIPQWDPIDPSKHISLLQAYYSKRVSEEGMVEVRLKRPWTDDRDLGVADGALKC
ncbi:uncharacterized protein BJ171DRAFT_46654 [Polychytrium aggregatum]|uniref:uncharacterized protein n=1 Tax=Polychytrium aggregatum TaxID=110093 RepID=UPI0022FED51A|nr:uncharacterized protein BJ171DRAFT_46654 [Polychytrium aggregatum]KAI9190803.1 hypothetical protein BJ171DRAFT_46654 [Polychytrium aggregatum]